MSDPVRICLLVDGNTISVWQQRALDRMINEANAEISLVVRNQTNTSRTRLELLKRAIELREWAIIWALRSLFTSSSPMTDPVDISNLEYLQSAKYIDCVPETVEGWKNKIPSDIARKAAEDTDVAIRFGFGFLVGDILTELEHGVLSFHHGDMREYRGQPMGCWEYIHGRDTAGITLQRINEGLDAGEVVDFKTVSIAEADTYRDVEDVLFKFSEDMLTRAITKLESGETDFKTFDNLGEIYTIPSGIDAIRFFIKEVNGVIDKKIKQYNSYK